MNSPETRKSWAGRVVEGKFALLQWLGGSDHSAVFLTERPGRPPQKAAIKLIAAVAQDVPRQLSRWRAASQLSHPHLIRIFETGRCQLDGMPLLYLVMEYAEEDLSQVLPQRPLTPAEAAELLPPMLDALAYLHGKGLVHGRIKPSNVLAAGDQLKISADQIASPAESSSGRRRRDVYDAPEMAAGVVSPASDLWSVGVTLVEALTQDVAFAAQAAHGDPQLRATIPKPFRGIARQCLQLDPRRRGSIDEIRARLQSAARSAPVTPEATLKAPASVGHYRYTWRMLIPIVVLLAFGLGVRLFRSIFPRRTSGGERQIKMEAAPTLPRSQLPPAPPRTEGSVLRQVLPDVPQSAKDTITGTIRVSVRVEVDSSGKVTAAELASPGPSRYFANLALKAARRWEFSPSEVAGKPAASVWLLRFRFRRDSTQAAAERVAR